MRNTSTFGPLPLKKLFVLLPLYIVYCCIVCLSVRMSVCLSDVFFIPFSAVCLSVRLSGVFFIPFSAVCLSIYLSVFLMCFFFLLVLSVCLCDCGVGWAEFNGECIYFSHDKHTFADAAVSRSLYNRLLPKPRKIYFCRI